MKPPPAMSWTEIQTGGMDSDPVMLAFALLSLLTVIVVYIYWNWRCR